MIKCLGCKKRVYWFHRSVIGYMKGNQRVIILGKGTWHTNCFLSYCYGFLAGEHFKASEVGLIRKRVIDKKKILTKVI